MGRKLADLVALARQRAGMENDNTCSAEEWEEFIHDGHRAFYEQLVTTWGSEHFATKRSISLTADVEEYPCPGDLLALLNVDYDNGTERRPCKKWELKNEHKHIKRNGNRPSPTYRLMGRTIYMRGTYSTGDTIELWYVPRSTNPVDEGEVYGVHGWDLWIAVDAAQKALIKEGSTEEALALGAEKAAVEQRINLLGGNQDTEPYEIVDEMGNSEYFDADLWFI